MPPLVFLQEVSRKQIKQKILPLFKDGAELKVTEKQTGIFIDSKRLRWSSCVDMEKNRTALEKIKDNMMEKQDIKSKNFTLARLTMHVCEDTQGNSILVVSWHGPWGKTTGGMHKQDIFEDLIRFVDRVGELYSLPKIIIAGDFNYWHHSATKDLACIQNKLHHSFRVLQYEEHPPPAMRANVIDYFVTTLEADADQPFCQYLRPSDLTDDALAKRNDLLDHLPVVCTLHVDTTGRPAHAESSPSAVDRTVRYPRRTHDKSQSTVRKPALNYNEDQSVRVEKASPTPKPDVGSSSRRDRTTSLKQDDANIKGSISGAELRTERTGEVTKKGRSQRVTVEGTPRAIRSLSVERGERSPLKTVYGGKGTESSQMASKWGLPPSYRAPPMGLMPSKLPTANMRTGKTADKGKDRRAVLQTEE